MIPKAPTNLPHFHQAILFGRILCTLQVESLFFMYVMNKQAQWYPDIQDIKSKITDKTKAMDGLKHTSFAFLHQLKRAMKNATTSFTAHKYSKSSRNP